MDVRCERCRTEYEFDDAKITDAGITVRCTVCSHVFLVKRRPPAPSQAPALPASTPRAAAAPAREWKLRQAGGKLVAFRELTLLQRWIVERKVARDDEISLTGESWKRLGDVAELASFFRVVEAAERATAIEGAIPLSAPFSAPPARAAPPAFPTSRQPAAVSLEPSSLEPSAGAAPSDEAIRRAAWEGAGASAPATDSREPAWSTSPSHASSELEAAEVAAIRSSRWPLYVSLAVAALSLGAIGLHFGRARPGRAPLPEPEATATPPTPAPTPAATAPAPAPSPASASASPEPASALPAATDAGPSAALSGGSSPDSGSALPKPAPATTAAAASADAAVPAPKPAAAVASPPPGAEPFDWYVQQGLSLRERGQSKAALQMYESAEALDSRSAETPNGKGFCFIDLGQFDAAVDQFKEALRRNARFHDAILGLAEAYREKGDKARAIENYQRYLDAAPNGPDANLARNNIERLSKE